MRNRHFACILIIGLLIGGLGVLMIAMNCFNDTDEGARWCHTTYDDDDDYYRNVSPDEIISSGSLPPVQRNTVSLEEWLANTETEDITEESVHEFETRRRRRRRRCTTYCETGAGLTFVGIVVVGGIIFLKLRESGTC